MKAIEKISAVQQAEEGIREYILQDDVRIGDKLPAETYLCEQLQVGRGTVREALRLLQAKGYVQMIPGKGAFVEQKEVSPRGLAHWFSDNELELQDILDVRRMIEPQTAMLAAQKADDAFLDRLSRLQEKAGAAAEKEDWEKLSVYDEQFHGLLFACAGNRLLISINEQINQAAKRFRMRTFKIRDNVDHLLPAHQAVLDALKKHDPDAARAAMEAHLRQIEIDLQSSKMLE